MVAVNANLTFASLTLLLATADISLEAIGDRLLQFLTGELTLPSREACRAYAVENYDWTIIAPRVKEVLLMLKEA